MIDKISMISYISINRPDEKFTSMYHFLNEEFLKKCFDELDANKAPGIDEVTKEMYRENLDENIHNLVIELKNKSYKPNPSKRVQIPKLNGKMRNIAISNFEDKIVQLELKKIIEAIWESKFPYNIYGFRPERSCHDAIKQLRYDIMFNNTNYVVEADIKGYFDNINHDKLMELLKLHIKDPNILNLVRKYLKAGILDKDHFIVTEEGVPQGAILSPVLANIYMYYILIRWFNEQYHTYGRKSVISYADDFVCCFERKDEAEYFYNVLLPNRLKRGDLELAEDKTRIIEFGPKAKVKETFDFLGFTFFNSKTKKGTYKVSQKTSSKKFTKSKKSLEQYCKQNRYLTTDEYIKGINRRLNGFFNYYNVTDNSKSMNSYKHESRKIVFKWINRRSQRKSMTWEKFNKYIEPRLAKPGKVKSLILKK